jgi:CBS-domain-containing membrane protein
MTNLQDSEVDARLVLCAATAADLMSPNPVCLSEDTTVKKAAAYLADKHICAAPVIDRAARPVGVLSLSDIVAHCREMVEFLSGSPRPDSAFQVRMVDIDRTPARDIMTHDSCGFLRFPGDACCQGN